MNEKQIIDAKKLSLDEWLELLFNPLKDVSFVNYEFPTDIHRQEYIDSINERADEEVNRLLLHFLFPSGSFGLDDLRLSSLIAARRDAPDLYENMIRTMSYKRLVLNKVKGIEIPPWEGTTWILDLLPHFPKEALEALSAYILAHAQFLPDGRYRGLHDAASVIRAKYIGLPGSQIDATNFFLSLKPREFECLVESLYHEMKYETKLTDEQKDGGRDVIAIKVKPTQSEQIRIECKRHKKPIGVGIVRELLGVVSDEKVNKGVLVTAIRFTKPAMNFAESNPRLELITGEQLFLLLNEHFGPRWPERIDSIVSASLRRYQEHLTVGAA